MVTAEVRRGWVQIMSMPRTTHIPILRIAAYSNTIRERELFKSGGSINALLNNIFYPIIFLESPFASILSAVFSVDPKYFLKKCIKV